MIKHSSIHLLVQIGIIIFVGAIAGFSALISFGAIGGVAMGVAPEPTFGLVEGLVCPQGTRLEYYSVKRSYHEPGESEPHVECIGENEVGQDVLLRAVLIVLGLIFAGVFLVIFIPMFIPLAIIGFVLTKKVMNARSEQAPAR